MCDTNWCTFCDNAISAYSNSLYCSEDCMQRDAEKHDLAKALNSSTIHAIRRRSSAVSLFSAYSTSTALTEDNNTLRSDVPCLSFCSSQPAGSPPASTKSSMIPEYPHNYTTSIPKSTNKHDILSSPKENHSPATRHFLHLIDANCLL
ncbi:hypothetical protein VTP01DRAFT_1914 [Rhizomucor pusillus]|uniref:uncharacterized protein n=1 Tax=Rhizomucor pusillus TaxID=4840 RepID=UPI0037444D34